MTFHRKVLKTGENIIPKMEVLRMESGDGILERDQKA